MTVGRSAAVAGAGGSANSIGVGGDNQVIGIGVIEILAKTVDVGCGMVVVPAAAGSMGLIEIAW